MIPLLFPFIADTVIAPLPDFEDIFVHEWGVVVFTSEGTTVAGAPDSNGGLYFGREPYGPLQVDAPVVWIHGAHFQSATFTVRANQGSLTVLYPPAITEEGADAPLAASWELSSPPAYPFRDRPLPPDAEGVPFQWAMDHWRAVPSRELFDGNMDYLGNFLYYESEIYLWSPPDGLYDPKLLAGYYSPEGLLIRTGTEPLVQRIQLVPLPDGTGGPSSGEAMNDEQVMDHLCGWAGGNLKSTEIEALWNTWKPFFSAGGPIDILTADESSPEEVWILFPLPPDEIERISSISLEVHDPYTHRNIHYHRLFLGLLRVR